MIFFADGFFHTQFHLHVYLHSISRRNCEKEEKLFSLGKFVLFFYALVLVRHAVFHISSTMRQMDFDIARCIVSGVIMCCT